GIRDFHVTGVQTCALPILAVRAGGAAAARTDLVHAAGGVAGATMGRISLERGIARSFAAASAARRADGGADAVDADVLRHLPLDLADRVAGAAMRGVRGEIHAFLAAERVPLVADRRAGSVDAALVVGAGASAGTAV